MVIHRMRNEYTRSDSLAWSNPGSNFWTMHASYERAAIRSQDDQDALLLLPFLCVCIYHMLWTYIFVWGAIHGILSILPLAETKRTSKTKGNRHQVHVDMPPSLNKRPFFPMRKAHGIIRDTAFDQILSQTLASHVELAMKGYLLLPPRSGLFAPVLILIVPRSLLLDALTPEAFAWVTFGERVRARSSYSHSRPVCVPWTSPSSRQHIIANVLQKFQCRSTADSVHNYTRCYTPSPDAGELSESGKTGIFKFELLSVPIRSRAGNNSTSSHSRPVESSSQQLRRSFDLYSAAGKITTQMQQSNNHNGGETSDEEEKDKEQPKKRKISAEVPEFRLPCIFHVFDQRGLTRDPKWKYCNPQTTYPDPSALSRHLKRKHDLIDDKLSVRTADFSTVVCKNCWIQTTGPISHWLDERFTCAKPRHKLTPIEKWWAWYEAFCGQRTMDASDYLDHLVADTRPHFASQATSQSPFEAQQRLGHATSQPLHSGLSIAVTDSVLPTTSWPNFESTEQFNTEPYIGHRQFPSSQQLARLPFNGHQSHIPPSNLHTSFVSNSETNHQGHQDQSQSQISGILGQDLVQESTAYQWPARMPSNALWLTSSSPPIAPLGRPALETLMAQLQLEAHLANEKAQLADKRAQMAEQRTRQAEKKAQKLEKQCNEQLSIIHRLRGTVSPSRLMSPRSADDKANPALFSTPVRTDTGGSTESDLSGITAPDPGDPGTVEDFIADVQSNAINESEQDLHGVQYLLEAEEDSSIPRAEHAKRSLDSGYGTNRTDDGANQFVRPSDTILSPVDPSLLYPHT